MPSTCTDVFTLFYFIFTYFVISCLVLWWGMELDFISFCSLLVNTFLPIPHSRYLAFKLLNIWMILKWTTGLWKPWHMYSFRCVYKMYVFGLLVCFYILFSFFKRAQFRSRSLRLVYVCITEMNRSLLSYCYWHVPVKETLHVSLFIF